jgi:osmotically-inducible protein OsmY
MPRSQSSILLAFGAATALALGVATSGCGSSERVSDATISESVSKKLSAEPTLSTSNINVETENGMVTIDGRVAAEEQRAEAERIARSTAGVKSVANLIEVAGAMETPPVGSPPPGATMPDRE